MKISRSKVRPPTEENQLQQLAHFFLGTIGQNLTIVSQLVLFNAANFWYLTSNETPEVQSPANSALLKTITMKLNKFCKENKIPLSVLIIPHSATSSFDGDEVVALPWEHLHTPEAIETVTSLFEMVSSAGFQDLVDDADLRKEYVFRAPTDV